MSRKNYLENKANRRDERNARPHPERRPLGVMSVSEEDALKLLTDPKQKLGGPARRYLMRVRSNVLVMPEPVEVTAKLERKLATLTLAQVIRRRAQFARRAATAKYLLAALSPDSQFGPPIQATQDMNLRAFQSAQAELDARRLNATEFPDGN